MQFVFADLLHVNVSKLLQTRIPTDRYETLIQLNGGVDMDAKQFIRGMVL